MENYVIQIKNLSKSFKVGTQLVPVLKNITFNVKNDDFCVIFGPSGCGKSTLLHTILGLEEPSSGECFLLNINQYRNKSEDDRSDFRKNNIGMVYQQPNWIKSLNVIENVAFPCLLLGESQRQSLEKAKTMLANVGLSDWALYTPAELSSGQQQKVALARAFITNPKIIIADEPTGNLDFESGQDLMHLLVKLNQIQGTTILMVTHDLEYLKFAKTVVKMFDGAVVHEYSEKDKTKLMHEINGKRGTN